MKFLSVFCTLIIIPYFLFSQSKLWGVASGGGNDSDGGSIYSTDINGQNLQLEYKLNIDLGNNPFYNNVIQANNGLLYGLMAHDVYDGYGMLFEINPVTNAYKELYRFTSDFGIPYGSLIQASDGNLYGMTSAGGANWDGTIFKYNIATHAISVVFDFYDTLGRSPLGNMIQASDGMLYGLTMYGGVNNRGTLFQFDITTNTFTKKFDFSNSTGGYPRGTLLQAYNGLLYGYTSAFGGYSGGTMFQYNITNSTFTKLVDFNNIATGRFPYASLVQTPDSLLYGVTKGGGSLGDYGTLFSFNPTTNTLSKKADFTIAIGRDLRGSLVIAPNGNLYGVSYAGGAQLMGALFEYNPNSNTLVNKVSLDSVNNGKNSFGSLFLANNGLMYGMTNGGGLSNRGVIFTYDYTTNSMAKLKDLATNQQGYYPTFLVDGSNGKLYGATAADEYGEGYGSFFEFDTSTKVFSVKKQITQVEGIGPTKMIKAPDGNFYGTFSYAGTNWYGSLYKYNPLTDSFSIIHTFSGIDGSYPDAKLILANDGFLYGTTSMGGSLDAGTIYKIDVWTNTVTKLQDFVSTSLMNPISSLYQASNGKMYGTTQNGIYGFGALYEYNLSTNSISSIVDFDSTNYGGTPSGAVIELSNGILGGTTALGGNHGFGVVYEYSILFDSMNIVHHFDSTVNGAVDELLDVGNDKFFGVSYFGGNYNKGVLYEYDKLTNAVSIKQHFNDSIGASPWIVPIKINDTINSSLKTINIKAFLQGYYMGSSQMTPTLMNEGVGSNPLLCDTVTVELHNATSPFAIAYSFKGIIGTNGLMACTFPEIVMGNNYFVVLKHRNSLETWSVNPISISNNMAYDFSDSITKAFGNNQVEVESGIFALYSGDINQDGSVDGLDYPFWENDYTASAFGYYNTDLNGDGSVDGLDYPLWENNYTNSVYFAVP